MRSSLEAAAVAVLQHAPRPQRLLLHKRAVVARAVQRPKIQRRCPIGLVERQPQRPPRRCGLARGLATDTKQSGAGEDGGVGQPAACYDLGSIEAVAFVNFEGIAGGM